MSGNVGIGTTAVIGRGLNLEVSSDAEWAAKIKNADADNGSGLLVQAGDDANVKIAEFRNLAETGIVTIDGAGFVQINGPVGTNFNDDTSLGLEVVSAGHQRVKVHSTSITGHQVGYDLETGAAGPVVHTGRVKLSGGGVLSLQNPIDTDRLTIDSAGLATFNADATLKSAAGAQTASTLNFLSTNYSSWGSSYAVKSKIVSMNTDTANAYGSELDFFTNDSTDNLTKRLTISSAGTTWASADGFASAYHTGADAAIAPIHNGTSRPGIRIYNINDGTASQTAIQFKRDGTTVGSITTTDSATSFNTSSDYRLKENVTALTGALDRLDSIPVYNFNFKSDPTKTVDGFLAHEVSEFVPEAIHGEKDEMETVVISPAVAAVEAVAATLYVEGDELPEGKAIGDEKKPAVEAVEAVAEVTEEQPKYQGIDQSKLVPLLVAAVKELKAKVTALENA